MSDVMTEAAGILTLPVDEQVALFSEITGRSSFDQVVLYGAWLSIRYAVDGHAIPPNTTVIDEAKAENPLLPCSDVITKVAGNATAVREELGFVTIQGTKQWPRATFIENGIWLSHMLGTPEKPVMPRRDDLELAARLGVGAGRHLIVSEFGNTQSYQDELGFVTETTLKRWTDDDWLDYGIWLSHMLGTPEKPAKLTVGDFKETSALNIGPPVHVIYSKYGSFRKYLETLGERPVRVDYKDWDKDTFIENGIWLSHMLGTPEKPRMPIQDDINEWTAAGLIPPKSAIDKKFKRSLSAYQDALGFVTKATIKRWAGRDWIDNGKWLHQLLVEVEGPDAMLTVEKLKEAADLNLVPKLPFIVKKFGSVMEYQQALGLHSDDHYKLWTNRQVLAHGYQLVNDKSGRTPTAEDYRAADGPGKEAIRNRFGTLAKFHERLGIVDYRNFSRTQLISFGVRWAHEHEGAVLNGPDLRALSKKQQGPGLTNIYGSFDNLTQYQDEVSSTYKAFLILRKAYAEARTGSLATFDFLTRDFKDTDEYKDVLKERVKTVNDLRRNSGVDVVSLIEMFRKSRRTTSWDKDDFIYFRSLMSQEFEGDPSAIVDTLHKLDGIELSPYLDEIEELFGTLEDFASN